MGSGHPAERWQQLRFSKRAIRRAWAVTQLLLGTSTIWAIGAAWPIHAAEQVVVRYLILERSVSLAELQEYTATGKASQRLQAYLQLLPADQRGQLRASLQERLTLEPITVAQLLYSPLGEAMLQQISTVIQTESRQANAQALRSALILATASPEGLSALSLIRHYPARTLRVDLAKGLEILKNFQTVVQQTQVVLEAVRRQADSEASQETPVAPAAMAALTEPGPWQVQVLSWNITDNSPQRLERTGNPRSLNVELYLPIPAPPTPIPLVVISHGLGADRYSYAYLGEHLASHGLAVAAIEHPGSSTARLLSFPGGYYRVSEAAQEFIDRPLDISFILDQLAQYPEYLQPWPGQVKPQRVIVIGQSFGGYTALMLAGATLNKPQLHQACPPTLAASLNVSLLLQCQATSITKAQVKLADPRVQAVLVINPISSHIFGPTGLASVQVPVMMVAGSADTIAPAVAEQIAPFTWLQTPERYLVLMDNATHFSTIGQSRSQISTLPIPLALIGPTPRQARYYLRAFSLAFVEAFLRDDQTMRSYLTAAAAQALSQAPLSVHLSQAWNAESLASALRSPQSGLSPTPVTIAH